MSDKAADQRTTTTVDKRTGASALRRVNARPGLASPFLPIFVFVIACLTIILMILVQNDGHFVYLLDDPYIHLALAKNIWHGHYGLNPAEYAAPSSSILWPLLLAPFAALPFGDLAPLLINILVTLPTILLLHRLVARALETMPEPVRARWAAAIVTVLLFALNLIGVAFTGMEHSAQILVALLVVAGLIRERETARVPWWLVAALVAAPLLRYECLALSGAVLVYLSWRRHLAAVASAGVLLLLTVGGFSLFLMQLGLGALPTSVIAKTIKGPDDTLIDLVGRNVVSALMQTQGMFLLAGVILLLVARNAQYRTVKLCVAATTLGFITLGNSNGYPRYELFCMAMLTVALLLCYQQVITRLLRKPLQLAMIPIIALLFLLGGKNLLATSVIALASNNVYAQHAQMGRFVADFYRQPVAANDIGLVSFRGGQTVLDLWGLGSQEALSLRRSTIPPAQWLDRLTKAHHVKLIMLYQKWFPSVPAHWIALGDLQLDTVNITPSSPRVRFYAVDQASYREILPLLQAFAPTLPAGASFAFADQPPSQ